MLGGREEIGLIAIGGMVGAVQCRRSITIISALYGIEGKAWRALSGRASEEMSCCSEWTSDVLAQSARTSDSGLGEA